MGKIKLCIFDMDGLLVDTERKMWPRNNKTIIEKWGYEYDVPLFDSLRGGALEKSIDTLEKFYGPSFNGKQFFKEVFVLNEEQIKAGDVPLMPGAINLLKFLKENNINTAIATSTKKGLGSILINKLGLDKYIDEYVFGDDVINGKPNPDIYLKAFSKFENVNKDEALIFEDAHYGARAGIAADIPVVLIPSGAKVHDDDRKEVLVILDNLNEAINIIKKINNIK